MSTHNKQLREAVRLALKGSSLKEGADPKEAAALNEKMDAILGRVFLEKSRQIIQKLSETALENGVASEVPVDGATDTDGETKILLDELDRLGINEIDKIEGEALDSDELPAEGDEDGIKLDGEGDDEFDFGDEEIDLEFGDDEMSAEDGEEELGDEAPADGDDEMSDALGDDEADIDNEETH